LKIYIIFGQMGDPHDGDYEWWTVGACCSEEHACGFIELLNDEEAECWEQAQEADKLGFDIHIVPKNLFDLDQGMRVLGPERENCNVEYYFHETDLKDIKMGLVQNSLNLV